MKDTIYKSENIYEERSYMAGKQAGIKEVVEWLKKYFEHYQDNPFWKVEWQRKLKEWGIDA